MSLSRNILYLGGLCAVSLAFTAHADNGGDPAADKHGRLKQAPMPHQRQSLPPSVEQQKYQLAPTTKPRYDLLPRQQRNSLTPLSATPECKDMTKLATYSGAALADYLVNLPDFECTYGLFSLTPAQGATIYSAANLNAIASRFTQEAGSYNASNMALVNLALYLRAGYYLAEGGTIAQPAQSVKTTLRTPIKQLAESTRLYAPNAAAVV